MTADPRRSHDYPRPDARIHLNLFQPFGPVYEWSRTPRPQDYYEFERYAELVATAERGLFSAVFLGRACGCASTWARSTTSRSRAARTRSRCSRTSRRGPRTSGSSRPSTRPTRSPPSSRDGSRPSTCSPVAGRAGTS
ncbi:hypothetical protein [Luteimicrobium album]|uniref:hypothetical protein n=1 Tax=Luteimicrobium album TaxID=1054550 RepID=UPI0032AF7D48